MKTLYDLFSLYALAAFALVLASALHLLPPVSIHLPFLSGPAPSGGTQHAVQLASGNRP